jgi:hypothetical protein
MTLDQYLERFVEGYLFEDLRSMAAVKLTPPKDYGGVGYPMVTATLAGIELLGVLTSNTEFKGWRGDKRFRDYWQHFLYPLRPDRQPIANAIYDLVRNGIVHTYTTKPTFVVTKGHDGRHMCWGRTDDGPAFWIDALTFAEESIESYDQRVKPRLKDAAFKGQMEKRYKNLRDVYRHNYEDMKSQLKQAPTAPRPQATSASTPSSVPNSPSGVGTVYSTNVTTVRSKGFK